MRRYKFVILVVISLVSVNATNRALIVGIGNYDQLATGWTKIHGDKDVELLKPLFEKRGFTDIVTLINEQATKRSIVEALVDLEKRSQPGDKIYFHFSGHGQPVRDDNHDEMGGKKYDESIIPYDACRDNLKMGGKYEGHNHLIDDELSPLLNNIKVKIGTKGELFVVVDACYSKGIQKDEVTDIDPDILKYTRGTDQPFVPKTGSKYLENIPKPKEFVRNGNMTVVTACQSNESNYEYKVDARTRYGSLSYCIYILLKTNADYSRWRGFFENSEYLGRNIFQPIQHPSIEIF